MGTLSGGALATTTSTDAEVLSVAVRPYHASEQAGQKVKRMLLR